MAFDITYRTGNIKLVEYQKNQLGCRSKKAHFKYKPLQILANDKALPNELQSLHFFFDVDVSAGPWYFICSPR